MRSSLIALVSVGLAVSIVAAGDNWPQFRGPHGDGHSDATEIAGEVE